MTRYAFDAPRRTLLASWPTGDGDDAATVVEVGHEIDDAAARRVGLALTYLSEAVWGAYAEPPARPRTTAVDGSDSLVPEPVAAADVLNSVTSPQLPDRHGMLRASYDPVVAAAEQLGRVLHDLGDDALTTSVADEVERELAAVDAAERGCLSGRAAQATGLSRRGASPVHMALAHEIMLRDPFDTDDLFTMVDPVSAAVVAGHWLLEAISLTAETTDVDPYAVLYSADDIQAFPIMSPSILTEMVLDGERVQAVIDVLIFDALLVARGRVPSDEMIADTTAEEHRRITPLDPRRPGPDLLEDLLACLTAAFMVWDIERDDTDVEDEDSPSRETWEEFTVALRERAHDGRWKIGLDEPPNGTDGKVGAYWTHSS